MMDRPWHQRNGHPPGAPDGRSFCEVGLYFLITSRAFFTQFFTLETQGLPQDGVRDLRDSGSYSVDLVDCPH
jgi:hypothetical protein